MKPLLPLLCTGILASACGCIMGQSEAQTTPKTAEPAPAPAPKAAEPEKDEGRVRPDWQKKMTSLLENQGAGYTDAFGLFSEGGWSDNGQVVVLATQDRTLVKVFAADPGKKTWNLERSLTKGEVEKVIAVAKDTSKLEDIDIEMFDGLIYEFVHQVRQANGKAKTEDRVYVKNPGSKPMPEHQKLIDAFQALRATK
jgi:hypothetical protein